MAKKPNLVAVHEIHGGSRDKGAARHVVMPGEALDDARVKKLGIDDAGLQRLVAKRHVVEAREYAPADVAAAAPLEGMSTDSMRTVLDAAGVAYPADATPEALMRLALEHSAKPGGDGA